MKTIIAEFRDRKGFTKMKAIPYPPPPTYRLAVQKIMDINSLPSADGFLHYSQVTEIEFMQFRLKEFRGMTAYYDVIQKSSSTVEEDGAG